MSFFKELLNTVRDFFISIFYPSSPEYQLKKMLKVSELEVRKVNPPIYRGDGFVLPGFATIVLQLYQQVLPLKRMLSSTIASKDIRLYSKYSDLVLEHYFTSKQLEEKKRFTYENRARVLETLTVEQFDVEMQEQKRDFASFIHSLEIDAIFLADRKIERLLRFFDLLSFNFNKMFAKFDASFEASIGKDVLTPNYNFVQVRGEDVLQDILDLNFLVSNTKLDNELIDAFVVFNSLLTEEFKMGDITLESSFEEIDFILNNVLHPNTLSNLIRLINHDPNFEDKTPLSKPQSHIAEYRQRQSDIFNANTKKLTKIKQDRDISTLITATFDKELIMRVSAYNDEINTHIQSLTHLSFDWVRPLEVIKTFNVVHFERAISLFLREVMVEGYFQNHNFQEALGVPYHYCENLSKKILEFESKFEDKGSCSLTSLNGYLEAISRGGDFRKQLARIVDIANIDSKSLCEDAGKAYYELFKACEVVLQDSKKSVPTHITNIRALSMSIKNRESYAEFEHRMKKFESFIEIIKNYIVLDNIKVGT